MSLFLLEHNKHFQCKNNSNRCHRITMPKRQTLQLQPYSEWKPLLLCGPTTHTLTHRHSHIKPAKLTPQLTPKTLCCRPGRRSCSLWPQTKTAPSLLRAEIKRYLQVLVYSNCHTLTGAGTAADQQMKPKHSLVYPTLPESYWSEALQQLAQSGLSSLCLPGENKQTSRSDQVQLEQFNYVQFASAHCS